MSTPTSSSVPTHDDTPRTACLDMGDGTFAEAAFFGDPGLTRFGVTHIPEISNGRGVVVCSPVYNDYLKNSRREVLLARRLARSGFTVQRFHYAGTGNSEGEILDMTLDSMITDTNAATDHLRSRGDVDDVVFMGTRIGAIPAGSAAASNAAALAVWEPIEGTRYFRELFRTMLMIEMTSDVEVRIWPISRRASRLRASWMPPDTRSAGVSMSRAIDRFLTCSISIKHRSSSPNSERKKS